MRRRRWRAQPGAGDQRNGYRDRDCQTRAGTVVAERYFAVGETDFDLAIDAILNARPTFVFNTLIGVSAYRFLRDFRNSCRAHGIDQASELPVASCSLSEPELAMLGPDHVDGHISSSVYFSSVGSGHNSRFTAAYAAWFPDGPCVGADAEATYIAVSLLARSQESAGSDAVAPVIEAVTRQRISAPQGDVWIDRETLHAALTPRIGRSTSDGRFEILVEAPRPVRPDPYLIWNSSRFGPVEPQGGLRVAS